MEYLLASWFGCRYFLFDYTKDTVPEASTPESELIGLTSASLGSISNLVSTYRTLNSNGYVSVANAGKEHDDATLDFVRTDESTYNRIRTWVEETKPNSGNSNARILIEVVPKPMAGDGSYEGTMYTVMGKKLTPGPRNTDDGQTFSVTVTPFGPPVHLTVTYRQETDTFAFSKVG